jgi:hypothetical protein
VEIRLHLGATDARGAARISARAARDPTQMLSVRYGNPDLDRSIGIGIGLPWTMAEAGSSPSSGLFRQAGSGSSLGQPLSVCVADSLGAMANAGLREQVVDVALHRRLADEQPRSDLAVGEALRDQCQDFSLAWR